MRQRFMKKRLVCILVVLLSCVALKAIQAQEHSDEEMLKYRQYMVNVQDKIDQSWTPGVSPVARSAIASFEINTDGSIANLVMTKKSGDYNFDKHCLESLISVAPFEPIPEWVQVEFNFDYNLIEKSLFSKKHLPKQNYDPSQPYNLELIEKSVPVIKREPGKVVLKKLDSHVAEKPPEQTTIVFNSDDFKKIAQMKLGFPLDCKLNENCFATLFPGHPSDTDVKDYACGRMSATGILGTDFSLQNKKQAETPGVNVVAAAAGEVIAIRDGMTDSYDTANAMNACGNSVLVKDNDGFEMKYCHLKNGSVKVKLGDKLNKSDLIGQVGGSGLTNIPQLFFMLKYKDQVIDPFTGTNLESKCSTLGRGYTKSLWENHIPYKETGLRNSGIAPKTPKLEELWSGEYLTNAISSKAEALVFWIHVYGLLEGDIEEIKIYKPDGTLFLSQSSKSDKNYRDSFKAGGKYNSSGAFSTGIWKAEYKLYRDSQAIIDHHYSFTVNSL